jgi:very-short-patch-repair endonuclease
LQRSTGKNNIARARELRENATDSERKLWRELRVLRQQGVHFRRQAPFRGYILDFVEHTLRLVIEVDGGSHAAPENLEHDAIRDGVLAQEGYFTLRIWNDEIFADMASWKLCIGF